MKKLRAAFAVLALTLALTLGLAVAVSAPASAAHVPPPVSAVQAPVDSVPQDPYPWYACPPEFDTSYLAYYYPAGGYYVAAAQWHQYGTEAHFDCSDINVEMWNTGGMEVRTQICPASGSCYALAWGTLTSPSPTYGVTAHWYHLPCDGACAFQFRVETRHWSHPGSGVAENFRVAF